MSDKKIDTTSTVDGVNSVQYEADYSIGVVEPISQHEGQLRRTFKARHIQMMTLSGCVGSGLFVSTGKALHEGGAGGMLIGYTLICIMALMVMNVLTEITCIFPTPGSFIDHAARFVDPAVAFAVAFTEWFAWMTVVASEAAVVRVILTYWTTSTPTAACMTVFLVLIFILHSFPNKWFAEFEFFTSSLKVIMMLIIIFCCIAIIAGAGNGSSAHSGNYASTSAAFPNSFKGAAATFTLAAWATGGQEIMGLTAGEAQRPRFDMPRACNNLFWRILIFFDLSIIFTTLIVNKDNAKLLNSSTVAASPFVIAMEQAGIRILPDILNAIILLGLVAIGAESMYIASRVMNASARMGFMPEILGRIDKKGRPYWALVATAVCSTICTYINCSSTGGIIFTWFSSISATVYFMTWIVMGVTNIQLHRAIKAQKMDLWVQPYAWKLRGFPLTAIALIILSLFVLITTGWVSGSPIGGGGNANDFFETFLGVPIWIVAFLFWKLFKKTKFVRPEEADLDTGRRPLSADDITFLDEYYSQPMWKRALSYVRLG